MTIIDQREGKSFANKRFITNYVQQIVESMLLGCLSIDLQQNFDAGILNLDESN